MNWNAIDFAAAALLLPIASVGLWLIFNRQEWSAKRARLGMIVLVVTILTWIHLSVGII